jgi:hypothetical protein
MFLGYRGEYEPALLEEQGLPRVGFDHPEESPKLRTRDKLIEPDPGVSTG